MSYAESFHLNSCDLFEMFHWVIRRWICINIWYDVRLRSAPLGNFCFSLKCCKNLFTMPPVYTVIIASWRVTCYDKKASISIKQTPERTMLLVNPCLDAFLRVKINWGALFRTWMIWLPYHFVFCSVLPHYFYL